MSRVVLLTDVVWLSLWIYDGISRCLVATRTKRLLTMYALGALKSNKTNLYSGSAKDWMPFYKLGLSTNVGGKNS